MHLSQPVVLFFQDILCPSVYILNERRRNVLVAPEICLWLERVRGRGWPAVIKSVAIDGTGIVQRPVAERRRTGDGVCVRFEEPDLVQGAGVAGAGEDDEEQHDEAAGEEDEGDDGEGQT